MVGILHALNILFCYEVIHDWCVHDKRLERNTFVKETATQSCELSKLITTGMISASHAGTVFPLDLLQNMYSKSENDVSLLSF